MFVLLLKKIEYYSSIILDRKPRSLLFGFVGDTGGKGVNMDTKALMKYGFSKDVDNLELMNVFQDGVKFKEVYIDVYHSNPFDSVIRPVLILRRSEKNVFILNNVDGLIFKTNDKYNTYIAELVLSNIKDCYFKGNFDSGFDFILNCQNIYYKITIFK